jgi:hypothetical protein
MPTAQKKLSDYTSASSTDLTLADILPLIQGSSTKLNKKTTLNDVKNFFNSLSRPIGKIIFVDTNGLDSSAQRGNINNPYATIAAALAVAGDGDWIVLLPGNYSTDQNLAVVGISINWFLYRGVNLTLNHATDPFAYDNDAITSLSIYGNGILNHTSTTATNNILFQNNASSVYIECEQLTIHKKISCDCSATFAIKDFEINLSATGQKIFQGNLAGGGKVSFENCSMTVDGSDPGAVVLFDFTGVSGAMLQFKNFEFVDTACNNIGVRFAPPMPNSASFVVLYDNVSISPNAGYIFEAVADCIFYLSGTNIFYKNFIKGSYNISFVGTGDFTLANDSVFRHHFLNTPSKLIGTDTSGNMQCVDISVDSVPRWTKYTFDYSLFAGFNVTTYSWIMGTLLGGEILHAVKIKHSTNFAGGSVSAVTLEIGIISNTAKYASAYDIHQAAADDTFQISSALFSENHVSPTTFYGTFNSTGGNVQDITQGVVDVWLLTSKAV